VFSYKFKHLLLIVDKIYVLAFLSYISAVFNLVSLVWNYL
jgi:hypothetical protein